MTNFNNDINEFYSDCFTKLCLVGEEVRAKEFDSCTFTECDFTQTKFKRCKFIDCRFIKCNLSVAELGYSKFSGVSFEECKVIGIDWSHASWSDLELSSPIKFQKCIINNSSFFGLSLKELEITQCQACDVDFRDCNLSNSNFFETDLSNSQFNKTDLSGASFLDSKNYNINIFQNKMSKAKFSRHEATTLLESIDIELVD